MNTYALGTSGNMAYKNNFNSIKKYIYIFTDLKWKSRIYVIIPNIKKKNIKKYLSIQKVGD